MAGGQKGFVSETPRIASLQLQTSCYGGVLPWLFGTNRITTNLIHYTDFKTFRHEEEQDTGGKGGDSGGNKSISYTYEAAIIAALCSGPVVSMFKIWSDREKDKTLEDLKLDFYRGTSGQSAPTYMTQNHADEALGYRNVAYVFSPNLDLGSNATAPQMSFEVQSGTALDENPADVVYQILTDNQQGAGIPSTRVENMTAWRAFCTASGILVSPLYKEAKPAFELIRNLLEIGFADCFYSGGVFKVVPYSDTTVNANGAYYSNNKAPIAVLTDDDFIESDNPIEITRRGMAEAYNHVTIKYTKRELGYADCIAEAKDQADIEQYGLRTMPEITMPEICLATTAQKVAQYILYRSLFVRNSYKFKLPWSYIYIEPCDVLQLEYPRLNITGLTVWVRSVDEDDDGNLLIDAEEYPLSNGVLLTVPPTTNGSSPNFSVLPDSVAPPVIFEPPVEKTSTGLEVWVAVTGKSQWWGGCDVYVSLDGITYKRSGQIKGGARYGVTTTALAANGNAVDVALTGNGGQLLSATEQEATALTTLCWIGANAGGEFFAHQGATLLSTNAYALTGLQRGAYSSELKYRASGGKFVRVDDRLFKGDPLDASFIGKTIHFKFVSFNVFGSAYEQLSSVTSYPYTITGSMLALPPSNVGGFTFALEDFGVRLSWLPIQDKDIGSYEIRYAGESWLLSLFLAQVKGTSYFWSTQAAGQTKVYIKAIDTSGNYSTTATQITVTVPAPGASNLAAEFVGPNVVLKWQSVTGAFSIDRYEIRQGLTWDDGDVTASSYTTTFSEKVAYAGARRYWVTAIDVAGNVGAPTSVDVFVTAPAQVSIQAEVIDNNVLLRWADAQKTLPIERYDIRKGASWATGQQVGDNGNGRFATFFEQASGTYTYWIVGYDSAGNASEPSNASVYVNQPPDYILRDNFNSTLSGTRSGGWLYKGKLYAPMFDETWQHHFVSRGWSGPQAQINAGFPRYFQPSSSNAFYEETIDYGATLPSTAISATPTMQVLSGAVTATPTISTKNLITDAWTNYAGQSQVFANNFRFVKYRLDFVATGGDDLLEISALNIKLSTKTKTDGGEGVAVSTDASGTVVAFNVSFIDVQSITVTPKGSVARIGLYDFVDTPYPTTFKVYLYDTNGNRVSGSFSWAAKGS